MIKRTPQEFADFFQCYVAKNKVGSWFMYSTKPKINEGCGWWTSDTGKDDVLIPDRFIETPKNYDWKKLYEPQDINEKTENLGRNCQKDDLCPHQSEVHTHKEYIIVGGGDNRMSLARTIVNNMDEGWKLLGGIAVDKGLFYQAMVRGI